MALYLGSKIIAGKGFTSQDVLGLPQGGTQGQFLVKNSSADGDAIWETQEFQKTYLTFENKTIATSAFTSNTTIASHPYRASIALSGVTASMIPSVTFSQEAVDLGILAAVASTYNGGVYIYASEVPSAAIKILSIICWE